MRRIERLLSRFTVDEPDDATITTHATLRLRAMEIGHLLGGKVHDRDRWIAASAVSESRRSYRTMRYSGRSKASSSGPCSGISADQPES